jgi:hypothetical protein
LNAPDDPHSLGSLVLTLTIFVVPTAAAVCGAIAGESHRTDARLHAIAKLCGVAVAVSFVLIALAHANIAPSD